MTQCGTLTPDGTPDEVFPCFHIKGFDAGWQKLNKKRCKSNTCDLDDSSTNSIDFRNDLMSRINTNDYKNLYLE